MATRPFTDLLPRVLPIVAGCPQPLAIQHIRDAAIRICERTLAWRYAQPTYNLLPGVHEYPYSKPMDTDVHVVFGAQVNGYPLTPMTLEQALRSYPSWADMYSGIDPATIWSSVPSAGFNESEYNEAVFNGGSGAIALPDAAFEDASEPRSFTQLTGDKYIVLPLPDNEKVYTIRMFYALKPKRTSTGMESTVLDELEEVIMHSALQHLLVIPNVAWTNLDLASYHAKQGLFATTERRARANLGNMRGTLVAYAPKFA